MGAKLSCDSVAGWEDKHKTALQPPSTTVKSLFSALIVNSTQIIGVKRLINESRVGAKKKEKDLMAVQSKLKPVSCGPTKPVNKRGRNVFVSKV